MNKVIIFSAPSGSGKTTLVKHCLQVFPELEFSISCTTRKPRGTEKNAIDYYFLTMYDFLKLINQNAFVEYQEVYTGLYYGTLKKELKRIWNDGKIVIFDVDVMGGINLKNFFGIDALSIFISPPSIIELNNRLIKRGTDDAETIKMRVAKAKHEMTFSDEFDQIVINDDLETAQKEIEKIVRNFIEN